RTGVTVFV
ncbi:GMC oxidoreductase family protein, partial [Vibrio parahaemolyticus V-223/04]